MPRLRRRGPSSCPGRWRRRPRRLRGAQAWPHALLLAGERGIGKRTLALHFARSLLCESPRPGRARVRHLRELRLRRCRPASGPAAGRAVRRGRRGRGQGARHHPASIASEALIAWSALTSHRGRGQGGRRSSPPKRFTPSAANALLKTLEEPPPATYLVLVAHQPGRIPATLRSRCVRLAAPRPSPEAARQWLQAAWGRRCFHGARPGGRRALAGVGAGATPRGRRSGRCGSRRSPSRRACRRLRWRRAWKRAPRRSARTASASPSTGSMHGRADLARVVAGGEPARNPDFAEALRRSPPRWRRWRCFAIIAPLMRAARARRASAAAAARRRVAAVRVPRFVSLTRGRQETSSRITGRRHGAPRRAFAQHSREGGAVCRVHAVPQGRRHLHSHVAPVHARRGSVHAAVADGRSRTGLRCRARSCG